MSGRGAARTPTHTRPAGAAIGVLIGLALALAVTKPVTPGPAATGAAVVRGPAYRTGDPSLDGGVVALDAADATAPADLTPADRGSDGPIRAPRPTDPAGQDPLTTASAEAATGTPDAAAGSATAPSAATSDVPTDVPSEAPGEVPADPTAPTPAEPDPAAELPPVVVDPVPARPEPPPATPVATGPRVSASVPDPNRGGYRLQLPSMFTGMVVRPSINFTGLGLQAAKDAVAEINASVPARWSVGPPLAGEPGRNEIKISYGNAARMCPGNHAGGTVIGCTGAIGDLLQTHKLFIVIDPSATASHTLLRHHVFHEIGHAAGLDHYNGVIDGKFQMMASSASDANAAIHYGPGDRNGLAALARNELQKLFVTNRRAGG